MRGRGSSQDGRNRGRFIQEAQMRQTGGLASTPSSGIRRQLFRFVVTSEQGTVKPCGVDKQGDCRLDNFGTRLNGNGGPWHWGRRHFLADSPERPISHPRRKCRLLSPQHGSGPPCRHRDFLVKPPRNSVGCLAQEKNCSGRASTIQPQ